VSTGAPSSRSSASPASAAVISPRKDSCRIPAAASDQKSDGAISFHRLSAGQPSVMLARMPELASMTTISVAKSRQPESPYDIRDGTAVGHTVPTPFERHWELFIVEKGVEILLFDHMLRADLPCPKLTRSNPPTDGLGVFPRTFGSFRHRDHCTILLHRPRQLELERSVSVPRSTQRLWASSKLVRLQAARPAAGSPCDAGARIGWC